MDVLGVVLFACGLLAACIMDVREQMVYRYMWLISGAGAVCLMVLYVWRHGISVGALLELVVFIVLQQWWFARFYGRADCHAYCVCAIAMTALGMEMVDYVMHMLLTFVGLAIVQLAKKNVTFGGRLKRPVALIPYITVAFGVWVDFRCGKWYI